MAKNCVKCGKQLSFRDSFELDGQPICGVCLNQAQASSQSVTSATSEKRELIGISGWLLLPALGLILGPIKLVNDIYNSISIFQYSPELGNAFSFTQETIIDSCLLVIVMYTAILFFIKRKEAPSMVIVFMITSVVLYGLNLIFDIVNGLTYIDSTIIFSRNFMVAAIWIPYFLVSKRVKATFIK